jgi:hypothetical protein
MGQLMQQGAFNLFDWKPGKNAQGKQDDRLKPSRHGGNNDQGAS